MGSKEIFVFLQKASVEKIVVTGINYRNYNLLYGKNCYIYGFVIIVFTDFGKVFDNSHKNFLEWKN